MSHPSRLVLNSSEDADFSHTELVWRSTLCRERPFDVGHMTTAGRSNILNNGDSSYPLPYGHITLHFTYKHDHGITADLCDVSFVNPMPPCSAKHSFLLPRVTYL